MLKKIIAVGVAFVVVVIALTISLAGPWPAYGAGGALTSRYHMDAVAELKNSAARSEVTDSPGRFEAGWATVDMTPTMPTPLGGFGARNGAMATGTHDPINVKALAVSDGTDLVVIVGSDMFTLTPNLVDLVRDEVSTQKGIPGDRILFNATHTHSGPAGFIPGFTATLFGGAYVDGLPEFLAGKFAEAISKAVDSLEPAQMASGSVDTPEYIKNRTRDGAIDTALDYLVFKQDDGDSCIVTRYSAHSTVIGHRNLEYSAGYPGYVQRGIEKRTGSTAIFLAGAVGSMGHRAPEGADDFARAEAMGEAMAERVVNAMVQDIELMGPLDVAATGTRMLAPPMQFRVINEDWRLSPFLVARLGLTRDSWLQTVRIGDVILVGTPSDFSGEISVEMRAWAEAQELSLWCLSFNGAYNGYISPDRYYGEYFEEDGDVAYETGLMSWAGPDQEAYYVDLIKFSIEAISPGE